MRYERPGRWPPRADAGRGPRLDAAHPLWGKHVGAVALDPTYGFYAFRYTPAFQASGVEPAPLHMPTQEDRTFLFTDLPVETYKRLPAMLADALPDDFGNALINRWMLDRGIRGDDVTALDRLAYMGNRAMGALQFRPARGPGTQRAIALKLSELVETARKAVHGDFDGDDHAHAALREIIEVGTSAGGVRAKAVVAYVCAQPARRVDLATPDVGQRQVQGLHGRRPPHRG